MPRIEIVPYRTEWPGEFAAIGLALRRILGERAVAIHHIGSTSVPGMPAKDVIDVQITVSSFSAEIEEDLVEGGFTMSLYRSDHCPPGLILADAELEKRLFGNPGRRGNLHMRQSGRFNQRYPLLCRDFLRANSMAANAYAEIKRQLARHFPDDVEAYYDIKDPVFDALMAGANQWAKSEDWLPAPTDA
ncbi:MAG: GrpB family protein [Fimbriimonas sp.]|nr:GrpB family protein [Fimbriimonas sp.]